MKPGEELLDDPVAWGRRLIEVEDHDPLYSGLVRWDVRGSRKRRFMLAYWCCYSVGASHYLSQFVGAHFWAELRVAAVNEVEAPIGGRWPRAHERRHWRGQKCVDSVDWLSAKFKHPEEAVLSLEGSRTLREVEDRMGSWPQFGPWISFKAADMLERVLGVPVTFPNSILTMYRDPLKATELARPLMGVETNQAVADTMLEAFGGMMAPGFRGEAARLVNIQEVETVLCKWKSARGSHYHIGLDTRDHRAELERWGAADLLAAYPTPAA